MIVLHVYNLSSSRVGVAKMLLIIIGRQAT